MQQTVRHTNRTLVAWTRAIVVGAAVFTALQATGVSPAAVPISLAVTAGVLSYLVADLGVLVAVVALSLPVLAAAPLVGIVFLVVGIAGVRYLGADGGRSFLVVIGAVAGVVFGPAWAAVAIAGLVLGAGEGALAAGMACLVIQAAGITLGYDSFGPLVIGADAALLDFTRLPASLVNLSWISDSLRGLDASAVNGTISTVSSVRHPLALLLQPLLWGACAGVAGRISQEGRARRSLVVTLGGALVGVALCAAGTVALLGVLEVTVPTADVLGTAGVSSLVALALGVIYERFYVRDVESTAPSQPRSSMDAEDADVDELLTLIATAEDRLATEHTSHCTVMITDMKSFSRMTEEDGSILTAKAIQRHRDLLLPIVERHGGKGKSTGGDGLIAAFPSADEALHAAIEMQAILAEQNRAHPSERELTIRIGIADGEVVLDRRGRPFIGSAINLAARIMNLADGGQAFAAASITRGAAVTTRPLGAFELKNIAEPVEVVELVWDEAGPAGKSAVG